MIKKKYLEDFYKKENLFKPTISAEISQRVEDINGVTWRVFVARVIEDHSAYGSREVDKTGEEYVYEWLIEKLKPMHGRLWGVGGLVDEDDLEIQKVEGKVLFLPSDIELVQVTVNIMEKNRSWENE